ncbi:nucleoid-associated protein [Microbulbifer sp. MCCC 1A16149]|uniref:nucleoid-associated protein n=1 Tax=Microbulbifer sp. MCCC 1A16149 TaxID=3411322 RepID=UPI003D0DDC66
MNITQSIIHGVIKEKDTQGSESVEIKSRDRLLPIDNRLTKLGEDILNLYGKLSNGYGILGSNLDAHRFPLYLSQYTQNNQDFAQFSSRTINIVAESMSRQRFATTSYPIFFRYTNQGREWILIAVLKLKEGVGIDERTLDLNDSLSFDITNLREAARIDIQKWQTNQQPYLSFIKRGSGSDAESSRYFRDALSCLEYTDAKFNTENVLQALDDFCENSQCSAEEKQRVRARVHDYCIEKKSANEPVNLTSLSAFIDDQDPEKFVLFVRENEYEVSETFSPHPESYKKLKRLSKKFGSISLGFDVGDLIDERVDYSEEYRAILIRNPPGDLIREIQKAKGEPSRDDE